jgi:cell division protein ZapA (FtsZ GTPase activity inhibitor)
MANELLLDILGTSFTIAADEDEAYLQEVLAQYRAAVENTRNISGISDALNVAVLTGFLLCDEINKMHEVEKRTLNIITKLDQALSKTSDNG